MQVDFGYEQVSPEEKTRRVGQVFSSVARNYDLMNDLMSLGVHRLWKQWLRTHAALRPGMRVLDLAGGTGDVARLLRADVGPTGQVVLADINAGMLAVGRDRLLDAGIADVPPVQANAEALPLANGRFDRVTIAFGLRNVTHKPQALAEMRRVLKPGGMLLILEFSMPENPALRSTYDAYSFGVLPWLGGLVAQDADSYRYLAESIRTFPDPDHLDTLLFEAGFDEVRHARLSAGIVCLHKARVF